MQADRPLPPRPPTARRVTKKQIEVLQFILDHQGKHGVAPTRIEMRVHFGWRSTFSSVTHIESLARKGLVTWTPTKARTLKVTEAGRMAARMGGSL